MLLFEQVKPKMGKNNSRKPYSPDIIPEQNVNLVKFILKLISLEAEHSSLANIVSSSRAKVNPLTVSPNRRKGGKKTNTQSKEVLYIWIKLLAPFTVARSLKSKCLSIAQCYACLPYYTVALGSCVVTRQKLITAFQMNYFG